MQKVKRVQNVSSMCLICGVDNVLGMHMRFFETEEGTLVGKFIGRDEHQSYPGRMHGGMICAILDEMIGRLMKLDGDDTWGVTAELSVRYRKPVPLGVELTATAEVTRDSRKLMKGTARILLPDGSVAAEGNATYFKLSTEEIAQDADINEYWIPDALSVPEMI